MRLPAFIVAVAFASTAGAQILPPVPPAAPATPPYSPPAPPPPPPTPPTRPEPAAADDKPLPSLVERDAAGKLKRYPGTLEDAAIAKLDFTPEQRARMDEVRAARARDIDKLVIERLEKVLEARRVGAGIEQIRDLGELVRVKDTIAAVAPEKAMDRLLREGAITRVMKARVDQMVRAYGAELTAERQALAGADILKIARFAAGDAFREGTADVLASLDSMLIYAARSIETYGEKLALSGPAAAAYAALQAEVRPLDATTPDGLKRRTELTRAFFFDKLDLSAQQRLVEHVQATRTAKP